jgi:uncharacterized protein (DUF2252 family)
VLELARYQVHRHLHSLPLQSVLLQAQRATPLENLQKVAAQGRNGRWRFRSQPPLLFRIKGADQKRVLASLADYRLTLAPERQRVFDNYRPAAVGFKVVGTGSVGVRDYVVLLFGRDVEDPLLLQVKEEPPSCYARHLRRSQPSVHQGQRVVCGQRLMQAQSDILLGWTSMEGRDYLVRQLNDHKAHIDVKTLRGEALRQYAEICGEILAKGHAHSANPCILAGYLGLSGRFDEAVGEFAVVYADQTEKDFDRFVAASRERPKHPQHRSRGANIKLAAP